MPSKFSKSMIDRLGDRLRKGTPSDDDLALLNDYRQSYLASHQMVIKRLRENLNVEPAGRPSKTTDSIVAKLNREKSIRLSQIQDIAGCRVVVTDITEQDLEVSRICGLFDNMETDDLRQNPSYGYRAVHVIVELSDELVEVQVRTLLQHRWAQCSERLADRIDPTIKYGGGAPKIRQDLEASSRLIALIETTELDFARKASSPEYAHFGSVIKRELDDIRTIRKQYAEDLRNVLSNMNEEHHGFLD